MLLVSEPWVDKRARAEVLGDPVHGREPTRRDLEASLAFTELRLDIEGVLLFGAVVLDDVRDDLGDEVSERGGRNPVAGGLIPDEPLRRSPVASGWFPILVIPRRLP